jgi:hypothetical protein
MFHEVETLSVDIFLFVLLLTHMGFFILSEWDRFRTIYISRNRAAFAAL